MSAIITDTFRRSNAKTFVDDIVNVSSANKYFIGIGRSDPWDAYEDTSYPIPSSTGGYSDSLEVLNNLQALQKLGSTADTAKIVIPNVALTIGAKYKTYNSHDSSCFLPDSVNDLLPCYGLRVVSSNSSFLYMCVGKDAATTTLAVAPTGTSYDIEGVGTGAGNVSHWVLVQEITSLSSDLFVEIRTTALTGGTAATVKSGSGGALTGLHVINGGRYPVTATLTGYLYLSDDTTANLGDTVTAIPTVNITTSISSGYKVITGVSLPVAQSTYKGITKGSVRIISPGAVGAGDYPAIVAPIVAPSSGFGYNPFDVMPSWFASLQATLSAIGNDTFYNSYRQISVIKNPNGVTGQTTYNALKYLSGVSVTTGDAANLVEGALLCQTRSGAGGTAADNFSGRITVVGVVDKYVADGANSKLYYHQNYWSGFSELSLNPKNVTVGSMTASGTITLGNTTVSYANGTAVLLDNAEITDSATTFSRGDVLFVENRKKITRGITQTENIKIIIQF